jgi:hypothetical protein
VCRHPKPSAKNAEGVTQNDCSRIGDWNEISTANAAQTGNGRRPEGSREFYANNAIPVPRSQVCRSGYPAKTISPESKKNRKLTLPASTFLSLLFFLS